MVRRTGFTQTVSNAKEPSLDAEINCSPKCLKLLSRATILVGKIMKRQAIFRLLLAVIEKIEKNRFVANQLRIKYVN